ncbi:MAG: ATP-binding protein [Nitrososphaerota archaeon]|nr:ATP-binding protein [Nitrososphaerota archaeon]
MANNKRNVLLVFCGLPGSGKSTVAKEVAKKLGNTVVAATDTFRFMIYEPKYTSEESKFIYDNAMSFAAKALERGYNVILDGTFLKEDYRQEALKRLGGLYDEGHVVFVKCDVREARARNIARENVVPDDSFDRMWSVLEPPVNAIIADTSNSAGEAVLAILGALTCIKTA